MIVQIRKNIAGTEYWDTEQKRLLVVPKGKKPDFEVAENPASMVTPETPKTTVHTDREEHVNKVLEKANESNAFIEAQDELEDTELDSMTIKQLREYAKNNNITIPSALKTRGDICALISDAK